GPLPARIHHRRYLGWSRGVTRHFFWDRRGCACQGPTGPRALVKAQWDRYRIGGYAMKAL
ncbi:MAG: hypothetical protein ACYSTZ_11750, partial [Planctomycetota bacterium]